MSDMRIYVLAGAFLIGAAAPSVAGEGGDGKYNGATQRSIYDVVRGEYLQGYDVGMMEGRAATAAPLPREDQWQREQRSQDPFYIRNETQTAD
jgi:hypothetical protein